MPRLAPGRPPTPVGRGHLVPGIFESDSLIDLTARAELVGKTPVHEIPELSEFFGVPRLMIKDESVNPCGTHKDRKSAFVVRNVQSRRHPPTALCLITAGSAALSLSHFAPRRELPVVAFVDSISEESLKLLAAARVRTIPLNLEGRPWSSGELQSLAGAAAGRAALDVTNIAMPYRYIAHEIGPYSPDVVVLPVGGGELFVGLAAGLRALGANTRLIGVAVQRRDTAADKLYASYSPYRETVAFLTGRSSPHRLIYLDDESGLFESRGALSKFVSCEPSSAVAFEALRHLKFRAHERVMVINTGTFRSPKTPTAL